MKIDNLRILRSFLIQNIKNVPGWRTDRRIVIIESDDWGSIRMPSLDVYNRFISKGLNLTGSAYNRIDSLESNKDLELLFDVLSQIKDAAGHHPIITANCIIGNPDFKKIKEHGYSTYFFESITDTLKKYQNHDKVIEYWLEGNEAGIFHPQFHGREHVNTTRWMEALRRQSSEIMLTFEYETTFSGEGDYSFMEVLDYNETADLIDMQENLSQGLDLFETIVGYKSRSFIPPCYTWDSEIEKILAAKGVKYIQGIMVQLVPTGSFGKYKRKYHFLGDRNSLGQYYLIRNCFFEPSLVKINDPVNHCLKMIDWAFHCKKPAIISSHRINYIGSLVSQNRDTNLRLLSNLLKSILRKWPDTEFMTSDQLGDLINHQNGGLN